MSVSLAASTSFANARRSLSGRADISTTMSTGANRAVFAWSALSSDTDASSGASGRTGRWRRRLGASAARARDDGGHDDGWQEQVFCKS